MILGLKTSDENIELQLDEYFIKIAVGRQMSEQILTIINQNLAKKGKTWQDLTGLVVFRGPGGYTSLRIGITVMNTLAMSLQIPIVGVEGDKWWQNGLDKLANNQNDEIITPIYLRPVYVTKPKK